MSVATSKKTRSLPAHPRVSRCLSRLAARGYDLILVARRADRLEAVSKNDFEDLCWRHVEVIAADSRRSDVVRVEKVLATIRRCASS